MSRFVALALVLCAARAWSGTLTIKGSDTMLALTHRWAQAFARKHPARSVQITGGGTSTGLAALEAHAADIATTSRLLTPSELARLTARLGATPTAVPVARDSVVFFVNAQNPVHSMTLEQVKGVLLGDLTRWSAMGGLDRPIIAYTRENTSGTYAFIKHRLLNDEDLAPTMQPLPGTGAVVNAVSHEPSAVGFGSLAFARDVRVLALRIEGEEVLPTAENIAAGRYPFSRELYLYVVNPLDPDTEAFLAFVKSPEGQAIALKAGFQPL